ncbi:hypothetical protein MMC11_003579 [Xylographa trunciseda]|nr:hypothetical protein [Xylographa trunciseda]
MVLIEANLNTPHHLQEVADILAGATKIVVVTGAGISTNAGIPDFRSNDGLYSLIETQHKEAHDSSASAATYKFTGRDLFDCAIWRNEQSTSTFHTFIASLRRKIKTEVEGTITHRFIRQLRDQRKLARCYTQNIDGLETGEGLITDIRRGKGVRTRFTKKAVNSPYSPINNLPGNKLDGGCEVVQLHGDLESLRCTICSETYPWDEQDREALLLKGVAPECPRCFEQNTLREDKGLRRRNIGRLRPNLVLYGEQHPSADELGAIIENDLKLSPEVVLILGTSLKVNGLQVMVKEFAKSVHAKAGKKRKVIFVNNTKPPGGIWREYIDFHIAMDCDQWVQDALVRRADLGQTQSDLTKKLLQGPKPTVKLGNLEKPSSASAGSKQGIIAMSIHEQKPLGSIDLAYPVKSREIRRGATRTGDTENMASIMKTPSKSRRLPTPPSSREHRNMTPGQFVYPMANSDKGITVASPAKRRRTEIKIWEDEGGDVIHLLTPSKDDSKWKLVPKNAAIINRLQSCRNDSIKSTLAVAGKQIEEVGVKDTPSRTVDITDVENNDGYDFHCLASPSREALPSALAVAPAFFQVAEPKGPDTTHARTSVTGRKRRRDCVKS